MNFIKYILAYFKKNNYLPPKEVGNFFDIKGKEYEIFAKTMLDSGIMKGYVNNEWKPFSSVTRIELARIIIGSILKADEIKNIYYKNKND